jgi:hypothetical protein
MSNEPQIHHKICEGVFETDWPVNFGGGTPSILIALFQLLVDLAYSLKQARFQLLQPQPLSRRRAQAPDHGPGGDIVLVVVGPLPVRLALHPLIRVCSCGFLTIHRSASTTSVALPLNDARFAAWLRQTICLQSSWP